MSSTIVGATNMTQLQENIGAWDVKLPTDVMQEIERLHLRYMNPAP